MRLGPGFGRLWTASTLSNLGGGIYFAALPMLATTLTSNPSLVAGVAVAVELPWLLFGLFAGVLVDRVDRRSVAVLFSAINAVLIAVLALLVAMDAFTLVLTYVFAFAAGVCGTLGGTATATMPPMLVPHEQLDRANGRLVASSSAASELAGPALGGLLFGVGAAVPMAIHSVTSAISAVLTRTLPPLVPTKRPDAANVRNVLREIREGTQWLWRHRRLRLLTLLSVIFAITDTAWFALLALYITDVLELPVSAYGYIVGIGAVGGLAGGLAAARIVKRTRSIGRLLSVLLVAAAIAQAVLAFTTDPIAATALLTISSFAFGIWNVVTMTMLQTATPSELLGRVGSASRTAVMAASPIGALLGGAAASWLGLRAPFLLGVPLLLVGAVLGAVVLRGNDRSETFQRC